MMKAAAIAALVIPVFCAAGADYSAGLQSARERADKMTEQIAQVESELKAFGVELPSAGQPVEQETVKDGEDTQVTSELGMFFDAADSRLIYLGNASVRDPRINILAREQLHIYLQSFSSDKKEKEPAEQEVAAPSPEVADEVEVEEPAAAEEPAEPVEEQAEAAQTQPASVVAHSVIADTINNAIYVYSPADGGEISLKSGQNEVLIHSSEASVARILADPEGNILLEGATVVLTGVDKDGGVTRLTTTGGHAYYHAATHTLHVPGKSELVHPDGTLNCTEMLCVVLNPAEDAPQPKKNSFMAQFTSLRFEGISTATASGQVVATGKAVEGRAATRAEGDEMIYNGRTGECSLIGSACRLVYGNYEVLADQGLHLLANGDIELRGNDIHGSYERESSQPGQMLRGTFKANANVIFRADLGTVTTEKGITLADDEADFSCSGPVHMVLAPKEGAKVPEQKPGMPNLAITRYGEVSRARAVGNVVAHRYEAGTHWVCLQQDSGEGGLALRGQAGAAAARLALTVVSLPCRRLTSRDFMQGLHPRSACPRPWAPPGPWPLEQRPGTRPRRSCTSCRPTSRLPRSCCTTIFRRMLR